MNDNGLKISDLLLCCLNTMPGYLSCYFLTGKKTRWKLAIQIVNILKWNFPLNTRWDNRDVLLCTYLTNSNEHESQCVIENNGIPQVTDSKSSRTVNDIWLQLTKKIWPKKLQYFHHLKLIRVFHVFCTLLTLLYIFWSKDVVCICTVQCSDKPDALFRMSHM